MKYLDVKWRLILDPETRMYMETAYTETIEDILDKISADVKESFYSGLFTVEIEE